MCASPKQDNTVIWFQAIVTRERRKQLNGHRAVNLWFAGLSGSGKSARAPALKERLHAMTYRIPKLLKKESRAGCDMPLHLSLDCQITKQDLDIGTQLLFDVLEECW